MAFTTLYYKTILRSDWRRLWPIPVGYTVIWFFMMPAMILAGNHNLTVLPGQYAPGVTAEMLAERTVMNYVEGILFAAVCMGLLLGASLFAYLMQSRSVGLMHSLPASRTTQFLGHCLSGVTMFTLPNLFIVLTTAFALGTQGTMTVSGLAAWFIVAELETFFFFMFAVLCCMATGWLLAVPVIFAGLNGVYIAYELLLRVYVGLFYWGCEDGLNNISVAAEYLTPIFAMSTKVCDYTYNADLEFGRNTILEGGIPLLVIYAVVALGMGAFAFYLYRIRHSESAMDPVVFPWLRPIVSAVISTASGMALGLVLAAIFGSTSKYMMVAIFQIICGAVVAIIMEMILQKTYKVFNKTAYKRAGAVILFIIILVVGARLDPFGIQKYVPNPEDVESVTIYSTHIDRANLEEPEAVERVLDVHRALLPPVDITYYYDDNGPAVHYCTIRYALKNGTSAYRSYSYYENNEAVSDAMDALLEVDEVRESMLLRAYSWKGGTTDDIGTDFTGGWMNLHKEGVEDDFELSADECKQLYNALMRDIDNLDSVPVSMDSAINLSLETKLGSYEMVRLYPECRHTIDLLLALGYVTNPEDLFYGDVGAYTYAVGPKDLTSFPEAITSADVIVSDVVNLDPNSAPKELTSFPDPLDSASLGIIGGADGPTQVIVATKNYIVAE